MSTHTFIQQNQDRIRNIDGNLDDGNITIIGADGRLEFYYFEDGVMVGSQVKVTKWWDPGIRVVGGTAYGGIYMCVHPWYRPTRAGVNMALVGEERDLE